MLSPASSSSRITLLVRKSIKQRMTITTPDDAPVIQRLMESFRAMCNDAIRIGLAADASSLKRLSKLTYTSLKEYGVPSYYKLCAISKAAGILAARKKSIRRGFTTTRRPYLSRPLLVSCYGFKIDDDGVLLVPLGDRNFARIALNAHTSRNHIAARRKGPLIHPHGGCALALHRQGESKKRRGRSSKARWASTGT